MPRREGEDLIKTAIFLFGVFSFMLIKWVLDFGERRLGPIKGGNVKLEGEAQISRKSTEEEEEAKGGALWIGLEQVVLRDPKRRPWNPPWNERMESSGLPGARFCMEEASSSSLTARPPRF